jgi:putative ABC transport system permease protein
MQLFMFFALISVIISCMGLYGLSSLMMEQRIREIGIRRVMGGSYWTISKLLVKQYVLLVGLGGLIAAPVAWLLAGEMISKFAYQIGLSPLMIIIAVAVTVFIAVLTIANRIYSVAKTNPVAALKYE